MVENLPLGGNARPVGPAGPLGPLAIGSSAPSPARPTEQGAAFRALLERLEGHARGLADASDALREPGELAGAVDRARVSLEDALSLGDQLLEAYRAANQRVERGDVGEA